MNPKDFLKNYWRNLLLVTINLFALSMIFFQGIEMEMDKKKMSGRFAFFTIPIALTHILYDTPMNYVGYRGIVNYFKSEGGGAMLISGIPLSEALRDESKLNVEDKEDFPWKLNDLGGIAYSALAFKIFGLKTESHYYFYFLILGASVLCYVVYFFKNRFNLMLSVFLLSGVYVTLFILGLVESQFGSIYGLRNLGILSLVALLHIVMILDEGKPFNIKSSFFITIQTLILVFVYFCRSSIMWQFGVIFVALLTLFFLHRKKFTYLKKKYPLRQYWPVFFIIFGLLGLDAYKKFGPDPRYGTYWGLKHETWHNLLMGLSYHPELSKILKMPAPDDSRADAAALQFIVDNNKALGLLNGRTYEVGSTFSSDWAKKKLYMDICKKNPLSCLELTVWVKPKALFNLFIWTAQFLPKDRDWLDEYNYKMISISDINRKKQDLLYNPFRWEIFTVVCLSILIGFKDLRDNQLKSLAYMGGIFISSLSIPILVYPAIFLLAVTYTTATALFYTCLGISLIFLFERLKALMNIQKTKSLSR